MDELLPKPDTTPTHLYNPLTEDYTTQMADDNNVVHNYFIPAQTIKEFPAYIANHIAKHLAQKIAQAGDPNLSYEIRYAQVLEDIIVKL